MQWGMPLFPLCCFLKVIPRPNTPGLELYSWSGNPTNPTIRWLLLFLMPDDQPWLMTYCGHTATNQHGTNWHWLWSIAIGLDPIWSESMQRCTLVNVDKWLPGLDSSTSCLFLASQELIRLGDVEGWNVRNAEIRFDIRSSLAILATVDILLKQLGPMVLSLSFVSSVVVWSFFLKSVSFFWLGS